MSGASLEPDIYVLNNANCKQVNITISDLTNPGSGGSASSDVLYQEIPVPNGCAVGHHGPWTLNSTNSHGKLVSGHKYAILGALIHSNGSDGGIAMSPLETFQP